MKAINFHSFLLPLPIRPAATPLYVEIIFVRDDALLMGCGFFCGKLQGEYGLNSIPLSARNYKLLL